MQSDRTFLGVLLMLAFCVMAPVGDSIAKLLGDVIGLSILLLVRFLIQAGILFPLARGLGHELTVPPHIQWLTWTRTVLHIAGIGLMFSALRFLPLADALAIAFVMPFIMLLLGHFALGEDVGPQRLIACAVGFVGTLLVIQPNFTEVGWPALLPLGVAVVFALFMLVTRKIAQAMDPIALQTVSGAQATVLLLPVVLIWGEMEWPEPSTLALLLALGLLGTAAHLAMTWSLRFAPASTLAPMQYLEIPFGTLVGWIVFRDLPNGLAALGIAITVTAGLYIIFREQRLSRSQAPSPEA